MARPSKTDPTASAEYKIEKAFWSLLEKTDFSEITMQQLAREAGVNRNTLYYHYGNLQEVAEAMFARVFTEDVSARFLDLMLTSPQELASVWGPFELPERVWKIHLFAKSESPLIRGMLKETLTGQWFRKLGIDPSSFSTADALKIDYIVSGFLGLLGSDRVAEDPLLLLTFRNSPLGEAAIDTLKKLSRGRTP